MPYIPDPLDDTKPIGSDLALAAVEFRALKTKLKEHETAVVTTLPNATTAVANDLAALTTALTVKKRVELTGSGNFTVPDGVTTLWVTARGGAVSLGTYSVTKPYGFGFLTIVYTQSGGNHRLVRKKMTVTPGQVIAFSVGSDELIIATNAGSTQVLSRTPEATNTTFGTLVAPAEVPTVYYDYGGTITTTAPPFPLVLTTANVGTSTFAQFAEFGAFLQIEY